MHPSYHLEPTPGWTGTPGLEAQFPWRKCTVKVTRSGKECTKFDPAVWNTWDPAVGLNDTGCDSGAAGEYNSMYYGKKKRDCAEGGKDWGTTGRWSAVSTLLRDVGNFDFRPRPDSKLIDPAGERDDIGAYQSTSVSYNIPGRRLDRPSGPVPPMGAFSVQTDAALMFRPAKYHATEYRVHFSLDFCAVSRVLPTGGAGVTTGLVSGGANIYTPEGGFAEGAVYFWRVDGLREDGQWESSEVWCFKVEDVAVNDPELDKIWNRRTYRDNCVARTKTPDCPAPGSTSN